MVHYWASFWKLQILVWPFDLFFFVYLLLNKKSPEAYSSSTPTVKTGSSHLQKNSGFPIITRQFLKQYNLCHNLVPVVTVWSLLLIGNLVLNLSSFLTVSVPILVRWIGSRIYLNLSHLWRHCNWILIVLIPFMPRGLDRRLSHIKLDIFCFVVVNMIKHCSHFLGNGLFDWKLILPSVFQLLTLLSGTGGRMGTSWF